MEKITLSLSPNYVRHWTIYDALRELYQNVFDRAKEDESAEWFSDATIDNSASLEMGNFNTTLERSTLILGETSKKDNKDAIGNFGEGYKLAILVLLRNGCEVNISTGGEQWTFKLEYNEQFKTMMLTVYIEEFDEEQKDLAFTIGNIPLKAWKSYSQYNLKLQKDYGFITTTNCEVLTDDRNRGKIFVGGLYVNDYMGTSLYGYNFKPHVFPLGRDRNIIEGFNANWQASKALVEATIDNLDVLEKVVMSHETGDTEHMSNFINTSDALLNAVWNNFEKEFPDTIPISYSSEKSELAEEYHMSTIKTAEVPYKTRALLRSTPQYKKLIHSLEEREPAKEPIEVLEEFLNTYKDKMSSELIAFFNEEILTKADNWKLGA